MGYCTCYSLELLDATSEQEEQIISRLKEMNVIGYALDEDLSCLDPVKWYDEEEDMLTLSREFPTVHFCMHGDGDSSDDLWDCHYDGGKMQTCMAEIPPFDPNKLE